MHIDDNSFIQITYNKQAQGLHTMLVHYAIAPHLQSTHRKQNQKLLVFFFFLFDNNIQCNTRDCYYNFE